MRIIFLIFFLILPVRSIAATFDVKDCKQCVSLNISNIDEYWFNSSGGMSHRGSYLGSTTVSLDINSKLLFGSDYGSIYISGVNNRGNPQSQNNLLTFDTISNIENFNSTKLYELYYHKTFGDFSFKIGKIDFSSYFGVDDYTGKFINGGLVTSTVYNNNSYFQNNYTPISSPGIEMEYTKDKITYKLGVSSDNPFKENYKNPNYPNIDNDKHGLDFNFTSPMIYYDVSYSNNIHGYDYNVILGGFYDSGKQPISYDNKKHKSNMGMYINFNQEIWKKDNKNLVFFSRFFVDPMQKYENVLYTLDCGFVYQNNDDYIGLSFSDTRGSKYLNYDMTHNITKNHNEYKLELTYYHQINKWFSIQPDIQYIIRPGGMIFDTKPIKNELIFGLRSSFSY